MRLPLAPIAVLTLVLATAPARTDALSNTERLPADPNSGPPSARVFRPVAPPSARRIEPGTNLARSAGLGARLPVRPAIPTASRGLRTGASLNAGPVPARGAAITAVPFKLLYAPAANDNPGYRAEIAALTGGVVDYFDARNGVPSLAMLQTYDCVYTWPDTPYGSAIGMGDRLADYVDAGGKVILGVFCTYTGGSASLSGRILSESYSPVFSPAGTNHLSLSSYVGDGSTSLLAGVLACQSSFRDVLALRVGAVAEGHYVDGELLTAWRPDRRVVYVNGGGGVLGSGDWARIIANAWTGLPTAKSILYAPSANNDPDHRAAVAALTQGPVSYFDARSATPSAALLATYDCVFTFASQAYSDSTVFGNRLADFVDAGGRVVLGARATFKNGNHLAGRIMSPGYSPVYAPAGDDHNLSSSWMGDGTSCAFSGVTSFTATNRDRIVIQGPGIADGHFTDGEIAVAYRPDGQVVYCNGLASSAYPTSGDGVRILANAATCSFTSGPRVLYAPADFDDPALRASLAVCTGGPVDYFDARGDLPSLELLQSYDCVYTWVNYSYGDAAGFGDRLANYVDRGGRVVLGPYCTFTSGNSLQGAIMGPGYCPVVSPGGSLVVSSSGYAVDGVTRLLHGVTSFDSSVRDSLALLGPGIVDATYADGGIAVAYRPDRRVIYVNGGLLTGTGQWQLVHRNAFAAQVPYGQLYATTLDGRLLTLDLKTGAGTQAGTLPSSASEIEIDETNGQCFYQHGGDFQLQQIFFRTGTGIGPGVPDGASFEGLEYALGRLYGTSTVLDCETSHLKILNPWTGAATTVGVTQVGPITGLAFDARTSTLYGVDDSGCGDSTGLYRLDLTNGRASRIATLGVALGSLEFGPEGDLYGAGGGINPASGKLYRIHPTTGATRLVGPTGSAGITGLAFATPNVAAVPGPVNPALRLAAAPNPSRGRAVRITFTLPRAGNATLEVFDVAGRSVWRRAWEALPAGEQSVTWNGLGPGGQRVAGGVYLARLVTPAGIHQTRIIQLD